MEAGKIHWSRSLRTRFGITILLLLAMFAGIMAMNIYTAQTFSSELRAVSYNSKYRTAFPMLYELGRLDNPNTTDKDRNVRELRRLGKETEQTLENLIQGDPVQGIERPNDPGVIASLQQRQRIWRDDIKPELDRLLASGQGQQIQVEIAPLEGALKEYARLQADAIDLRSKAATREAERINTAQWVIAALALLVLLWAVAGLNGVVKRTVALAAVSGRVREGDLDATAPATGSDELASLGTAFNEMTADLKQRIESETRDRERLEAALTAIADSTHSLSSAATEILASTSEQAAGMREQASAVAETVTTVDEVLQTSEQAAERANAVFESSQRAAEVSSAGRQTVDETVELMTKVQEQSSAMAEGIMRLAEHGQEIGEIIAAVTDIADQTNLLAVNASIEASRAGQHGTGFTVVASEIKELSEQSKKATTKIRQILNEIQKSTNRAVLATEESTKSVSRALKAANESGNSIRSLEETIIDASRAAAQIAASSAQQNTGMSQIQQAMSHINEASTQNLAATKQTEQAAKDLNDLGRRLKDLLLAHGR